VSDTSTALDGRFYLGALTTEPTDVAPVFTTAKEWGNRTGHEGTVSCSATETFATEDGQTAASLLRRSRRRPRTSWDGWRWLQTPFELAVQARTLLPAVGGELVGFAQRIEVQGRSECAVPDLSALVRGIR
jgi:hypothetical protein